MVLQTQYTIVDNCCQLCLSAFSQYRHHDAASLKGSKQRRGLSDAFFRKYRHLNLPWLSGLSILPIMKLNCVSITVPPVRGLDRESVATSASPTRRHPNPHRDPSGLCITRWDTVASVDSAYIHTAVSVVKHAAVPVLSLPVSTPWMKLQAKSPNRTNI